MIEKVVEGSYKIVKQEPHESGGNALIVGVVYDKKEENPIKGAIVQIEKINKGVFTDDLGNYALEIPNGGLYEIQVVNVGNTTLMTKSLKLEGNTKMEIVFYLGTTWIH